MNMKKYFILMNEKNKDAFSVQEIGNRNQKETKSSIRA